MCFTIRFLIFSPTFSHFVYHPDVQLLLPEPYASLPLADLKNNADFQQQAYANMLLATNFIVNNLDNPEYLEKHFRRLDNYWGSKWYVTYVDEQRQLAVSSMNK